MKILRCLVVAVLALTMVPPALQAAETDTILRHPRPSGFTEADAPAGPTTVEFEPVSEFANVPFDIVAKFPKGVVDAFQVERVLVNGAEKSPFVVANRSVFNGNRWVHGTEDFSVSVYSDWQPGTAYEIALEGKSETGEPVRLAANETAPAERKEIKGPSFGQPTAEFPYHHLTVTLAKEALTAGKVVSVTVDGHVSRDARYFNHGKALPGSTENGTVEGETYDGIIGGDRDFQIVAPVNWLNGSTHSVKVVIANDAGEEKSYEKDGTAPGSGGYWSADWPRSVSLVLHETAGIQRQGEPVHATLGLFADDITKPENEIRVVTHDPNHPKAGADGYVVAPCQVTDVSIWRDEELLNSGERDAETGELVHRYDATTTVELVFFADVQPYELKVYQVVYGNPNAEPLVPESDLHVAKGEGLSQTVTTDAYEYFLSVNSGAVEQVTIRGEGDPVLLEHKLETNGAVHWNPGFYPPPTPWVHASDWETPIYDEISGPIMHRTRRYAPLPHLDAVNASISYEFYAGKPYVMMNSYMEVIKDYFVMAARNGELVFNHAVLNEFVWKDPLGKVQSLEIETSRKHPIHALEIPADTPWMAFINREQQVGFASINLDFDCGNKYGQPPSAQPYYYIQNGPWIYWSRPLVYPFGGLNFTRMMPVRAGSYYTERTAWVPFRFADDDDPFEDIESLNEQLTKPLLIHEWMGTDDRTPTAWVMPILTMPFDEGVEGALSGHKDTEEKE
jgi:hypothetical protein